jgi:hypothetical protein
MNNSEHHRIRPTKNTFEWIKHNRLRAIVGLGGFAFAVGGAFGAYENSETQQIDQSTLFFTSNTDQDVLNDGTPNEFVDKQMKKEEIPAIEPNVNSGNIKSVNLFGNFTKMGAFEASKINDGTCLIDLTPPMGDDIYSAEITKCGNPEGYDFNGTLEADDDGNVIGDLLLGGHSFSKGEWIMNGITKLKVGDIKTIKFKNAKVDIKITKVTPIVKEGANHELRGFADALGRDGAIYACELAQNKNGDTVQSGRMLFYGIKVVALY